MDLRGGPAVLVVTVARRWCRASISRRPGPATGLANMRDRVESAGGTLTIESTPVARHAGRGQTAGRAPARGAEMYARVAWSLAVLTVLMRRRGRRGSPSAYRPLAVRGSRRRARVPVRHRRGRRDAPLMGALIVARLGAAPDRLAALPDRVLHRDLVADRGLQRLGAEG